MLFQLATMAEAMRPTQVRVDAGFVPKKAKAVGMSNTVW